MPSCNNFSEKRILHTSVIARLLRKDTKKKHEVDRKQRGPNRIHYRASSAQSINPLSLQTLMLSQSFPELNYACTDVAEYIYTDTL